jgi:hypothetical protein
VSRLSRLSARAYGRLSAEQRRAVDVLRYEKLDAAGRGEQKTILGWRRTAEETAAYARTLIAAGMMLAAVAARFDVEDDYLRRLLEKVANVESELGKRSPRLKKSGLTDNGKVVGQPPDSEPVQNRPVYDGDPFAYELENAVRRASSR